VLRVATLAYFAGVYRHRLVALGVIARVMYTFAGVIAIGGITVGRYGVLIWVLRLRTFFLRVLEGIYGRLGVFLVGFQMSE